MNTIKVMTINGPMLASKNNKIRPVSELCMKHNDYTCPYDLRTENQHKRFNLAARLIKRELNKYYRHGVHYRETLNGCLWPIAI